MEKFKGLVKPFERIINTITLAGGRFIFVGGCVRDVLLDHPPKDVDAEVYGLSMEKMKQALNLVDVVSEVGKQFGVLKLKNYSIDIALPRLDKKINKGHKGFSVKVDYTMSFRQAAKRRDLTINAIGFDPMRNELLDPYNGVRDLHHGVLRPVDPQTFVEDPLRALRVAQFSSRFLLKPHQSLVTLCARLDMNELSNERIFEELKKMLIKGQKPSLGFSFLKETRLLQQVFPSLAQLSSEAWQNTLNILDDLARVEDHKEKKLIFMLGSLCFPMHECNRDLFLKQCLLKKSQKNIIEILLTMAHHLFKNQQMSQRFHLFWTGKKLLDKGSSWGDLLLFLKTLDGCSWVRKLSERVLSSGAAHPKNLEPVVRGHHLIARGIKPSKEFSVLLKKGLDVQYEQGLKNPTHILEKIF